LIRAQRNNGVDPSWCVLPWMSRWLRHCGSLCAGGSRLVVEGESVAFESIELSCGRNGGASGAWHTPQGSAAELTCASQLGWCMKRCPQFGVRSYYLLRSTLYYHVTHSSLTRPNSEHGFTEIHLYMSSRCEQSNYRSLD
jgi:hypothetical protein